MIPTIGLAMIVKNEAHVIRRCLESVKSFISHWTIVDSSSTDDTEKIVREVLAGIPGEFHNPVWEGHGKTRSVALELARPHSDYTFMIDADDYAEVTGPVPDLSHDAYHIKLKDSTISYNRIQIFKNSKPWRYEGAAHEYPTCDVPTGPIELTSFLTIKATRQGSQNTDPVKKYQRDASVLESELQKDPTNARNVFYCAQSHRDAGDDARALKFYKRRVAMGGWDEEVFTAMLEVAKAMERMKHKDTADAYLAAYQFRPYRAEPLVDLARYYRGKDNFAMAHLYARTAASMKKPGDVLFVNDEYYKWVAKDELAISDFFLGRFDESSDICAGLLASEDLPAHERARVISNMQLAQGAMK